MADKTITLSISGPEEILIPTLESFAAYYGWEAQVKDDQGDLIPNPVSQFEKAEQILHGFIFEAASVQEVNKVQDAARKAAVLQKESAMNQTSVAIAIKTKEA